MVRCVPEQTPPPPGCYVRISLAPPCGCCILCLTCAESSPAHCAKCNTPYSMQAVEDPGRRDFNDNPKWAVPHELIEWQPAFVGFDAQGHRGGHWSADWRSTHSSKVTWLIERLRLAGAAPPLPTFDHTRADDAVSESSSYAWGASEFEEGGAGIACGTGANRLEWTDAASDLLSHEGSHEDSTGDDHRGGVGMRVRVAAASSHSSDLAYAPHAGLIQTRAPPKLPPGWFATRKAIVYSSFWEHIQLIRMHLTRSGVPFAKMLRWGLRTLG